MEFELERAIRAQSKSLSSQEKMEATQYCESFKSSMEGFQCSLQIIQNFRTKDSQIVFFAFQVIEQVLITKYDSLDSQMKASIRDSLWNLLLQHISDPIQYFLRNKLFLLVVLIFRNEYLSSWSNFFEELVKLKDINFNGIEAFLQISLLIDEEVVCKYIQRDANNLAKNTDIKDSMRVRDVSLLVENWWLIFQMHYQNNVAIGSKCLQLFGLYVSWIDIGLVLRDGFVVKLYESMHMPELRNSACECLTQIVLKGMPSTNKLQLLQGLNILEMVKVLNISEDPEFGELVAKLLNAIGSEVCDCVGTDYQESLAAFAIIESLLPILLEYLASEFDDISECLFPFLTQYFLTIKRLQKQNIGGISNDNLGRLLDVLLLKMKYGNEVQYQSDGDPDDEDTLFLELRKALKVHLESFATLDKDLFATKVCASVMTVLETMSNYMQNPSNGFSLQWNDCELALYLIYIYTETSGNKGYAH